MVSWLRPPLRPEELIKRARRSTGLGEFGDTPFRAGLQQFLDACADEAELSLFGHLGTRWDVVRFLSNLLRLHHEEVRAPQILDQPIVRPIFIAGLPRSGTTFLHQLLAIDPANQAPLVWQAIHPYPPLGRSGGEDRRRRQVDRQLRMFALLAPEFRRMHPIAADSPQECSEIGAHIFASPRFDTTYNVPSYRRWLDAAGHLDSYRFHRRFLQHLQHQSGSRGCWVLKCPDHAFALGDIRAVYPDARMVLVHRDPVRVMASVARLTEVLRRPFTRRIDRAALGRQECERWGAGAALMIGAADAEPFAEPIFHVDHQHLVRDPLNVVRALYRHFGIGEAPEGLRRMGSMVAANPNGGYGANRYSLATYGLDAGGVRERFAAYAARFGITPEPLPGERARAPIARPRTDPSIDRAV